MDVISSIWTDAEDKKWITVMCPVWFTLDEHLEDARQQMEDAVRQFWNDQEIQISEVGQSEGPDGSAPGDQPMSEEVNGDQSRNGETQ